MSALFAIAALFAGAAIVARAALQPPAEGGIWQRARQLNADQFVNHDGSAH